MFLKKSLYKSNSYLYRLLFEKFSVFAYAQLSTERKKIKVSVKTQKRFKFKRNYLKSKILEGFEWCLLFFDLG